MANNTLAPGLLLAAPRLGDPNFERTVVLLGRHESEGSLGWVINGREVAPVGELMRDAGLLPAGLALPDGRAFKRAARVGGPVSPSTGWLVYLRSDGAPLPGEIEVGPELGVSGDAAVFQSVMRGAGPADFRVLLGYAGWGPGQLEGEVQTGAWLPVAVDAPLLLETAAEALWDAAYRSTIGAAPAAFMSSRRGSA